ncbi:MAG: HEPN domain-containing protein [Candidatus Xenobia bacterium]
MTSENRKHNISLELAVASEDLRMAELALREAAYRNAVSAAYYHAFHCGRALVLSLGLEAKTHSGVQHLINMHFVQTGRMKPETAALLRTLERPRLDADYDASAVFTPDMAREEIERSRAYGLAVQQLLKADGYS